MDNNSDTNRDTDVSSTTADVPEIQVVTGSDSNVEMIVTIEKLELEDQDPTSLLSSVDEAETSNIFVSVEPSVKDKPPKSKDSPQKLTSTQKVTNSPIKESLSSKVVVIPPTTTSPLKVTDTLIEVVTPSKNSPKNNETIIITPPNPDEKTTSPKTSPSKESHQIVDSSSKTVSPIKNQDVTEDLSKEASVTRQNEAETFQDPPIATSSEDMPQTTDSSEKSVASEAIQKQIEPLKPFMDNHCDKFNDSHLDTNSEISEKEHKHSISRELKSLINSAKESKIISECTQLTSKTRKSRTPLELSTSIETEKVQVRRNSNVSTKSNNSEKSEKAAKRSMRSQNPEFVNKVKQFLNSVVGKNQDSDEDEPKKNQNEKSPSPKKRKVINGEPVEVVRGDKKLRIDPYCWRCHWAIELGTNEKTRPPMKCTVCPRVFHYKCLSGTERKTIDADKSWVCPECLAILHAESSDTRSVALKQVSVSQLGELLNHALTRMMELNGVEPFMQPVDRSAFPDYNKCVVHPMDLSQMQRNIANGLYGSPEAFLSDTQWILHNSIIFNTLQSKLTLAARALVRLCRSEMGEIEACPECYAAAHARRPTWFTDVCSKPHILLWAKLKGFPYWPAKGMSVNGSGVVDVRFFGAHDRAWVPAKDCFLYSEKDPNNIRSKKQIVESMQEAEQYIRNISRKYGKFVYPPFKTPFEPAQINEQFKMMIPTFEGELKFQIKEKSGTASPKIKEKRSSNSKSSVIDGEASDNEEMQGSTPKHSIEISKLDTEPIKEDNEPGKPMDVDETQEKEKKVSRKRRRSERDDSAIIDSSSTREKRRRIDNSTSKQTDRRKRITEAFKQKAEEANTDKAEDKRNEKIIKQTKDNESKEVEPNSTTDKKEVLVTFNKSHFNSPKTNQKPQIKTNPKESPKPKHQVEKTSEKEEQEGKMKEKKMSRGKTLIVNNVSADKTAGIPIAPNPNKDKNKSKTKSTDVEILISKNMINKNLNKNLENFKPTKERLQFDDDTTLAVLAREVSKTGMPTITSVRSLSDKQPEKGKILEVTVDANSNASIFTTTSTESVKNMQEAAGKLQKIRETDAPVVGRVGVRAFARMTSTEMSPEVEIKAEPMDFDSDRQVEKLEVMNSFRLQPVNQTKQLTKLREVRINKLVVTPLSRKTSKPPETRVKAKKTFPQLKKQDSSELNSKNSMVFIPIQPPSGQAPVRPIKPAVNGVTTTPTVRPQAPLNITAATSTAPSTQSSQITTMATSSTGQNTSTVQSGPAVNMPISSLTSLAGIGPNVHTVPFITSMVNGQWAFSLQPMMSVGGVDTSNGPMVNGLDRSGAGTLVTVPTPVSISAVTQINARKDDTQMPRLQHKPMLNPFDPSNTIKPVPPPSTVGPLTAKINQNAQKITDLFRTLLEESLEKVNEPSAQLTSLKLQLEQLQWKHKQEVEELKHNHDLAMVEMRCSLERDKTRAVNEERRTMQLNLEAAVKAAKSKQWCANCNQEAQFYCCWNTSYCDYPCQRAHWTTHATLCTQAPRDSNGNDSSKDIHARLQPAPDRQSMNKSSSSPQVTKATRVYTKEMHPKTSLIVSMVEDSSGNQTVKCVGTYKPNTPAQPVIINQQLHNEEASAKKVTTSGGYLIVGGGASVTAPRRSATVQQVHSS